MNNESFAQMQFIEQNLQHLLIQKQQFQSQLIEVESALEELSGDVKSWKIIGNIMVQANTGKLSEDLASKKNTYDSRIKLIEEQEEKMRGKLQQLQQEVTENGSD